MKKTPFLFPKIVGILFALSVITACPELPDFEINTVDLGGLKRPYVDDTKAEHEKLVLSPNATYFIGKITWYHVNDNDNTFTSFDDPNGEYRAEITLYAKPGFVFADYVNIVPGNKRTPSSYAGQTVVVSVTFTVNYAQPIRELELSHLIPYPVTGHSPARNLNFNQFTGLIEWNPPVGLRDGFTGGKEYTATVTLTAEPGNYFDFPVGIIFEYNAEGIEAAVNLLTNSRQEVKVTIEFPATALPQPGGQDYIAVAGGQYDSSKSQYIFFILPENVTITRPQVVFGYPFEGPASFGSSNVCYINISSSNVPPGIVKIRIDNPLLSSGEKEVMIHGDSTPGLPINTIDSIDLGIKKPETGGTPDPEVKGRDEYYGGYITWTPTPDGPGDTFRSDETYTAVFNLTVKKRNKFSDTPVWIGEGTTMISANFTGFPLTLNLVDGHREVTVVFPPTAPATTISLDAVPGVTAPVTGQPPVRTIDSAQYTGAVTWAPTVALGDTFAASTAYTATITLTAKPGFKLDGVAANFFNVEGTSTPATNAADSGVITAVFPTTEAGVTTINIPAVLGVTAPVTGATPDTTVTETVQYTGIVTWSPSVSSTFAASTIYTATITLTAKPGYTLTGVAANFFTVAGTSPAATNPANSGVITARFPATGAWTIPVKVDDAIQNVSVTASTGATVSQITNGYQVEINNYGPYAWFKVDLGAGKTISDFSQVKFDFKAISGDISWKTLNVLVSDSAFPNTMNNVYEPLRVSGAGWPYDTVVQHTVTCVLGEVVDQDDNMTDVSANVTNRIASEVYVCVYVHAAGTGDLGGTGVPVPTTYSVANIEFIPASSGTDTPITAGALGVTAPVRAVAPDPVVTVTGTGYSSGDITWYNNGTNVQQTTAFAANTVYRAEFTLTAAPGYTFDGIIANSFTHSTGTVTHPVGSTANTLAISVVFPATAQVGTATMTFTVTDAGGDVTIAPTPGGSLSIPKGDPLTLTVDMTGITYDSLAWYVDGSPQPSGTTSTIDINTASLGIGSHTVFLRINVGSPPNSIPYSSQEATFTVE